MMPHRPGASSRSDVVSSMSPMLTLTCQGGEVALGHERD